MPQHEHASSSGEPGGDAQYVCFRLAGEEFCVGIHHVKEIVRLPEITAIPRTPPYLRGIANLRGNVLPVIDCRRRFSLPDVQATERTRVLVLEPEGGGELTGVIVDGVSEVLQVSPASVEKPPEVTANGVAGDFLAGVVKLGGGKRLILQIRPQKMVGVQVAPPPSGSVAKAAGDFSAGSPLEPAFRGQQQIPERHVVSFTLDEEEYAFDIGRVREILRQGEITAVPNSPAAVKGLLTVRDHLLPVLDLRALLNLPTKEDEEQRILVLDAAGHTVGLLVDRVNEVLRIPVDHLEGAGEFTTDGNDLDAVARVGGGKRLILILNADNLIEQQALGDLMRQHGQTDAKVEESKDMNEAMDRAEEHLVTFLLGSEEYGIPIMQIQEINRLSELTRLPRAPKSIAGITNLRGQVIPLVDLRHCFGLAAQAPEDRSRIIIVDMSGQRTGLIVDQVNEVLRIPATAIEKTPNVVASEGGDARDFFVTAIGKVNGGKRMILVLDVAKILSKREQDAILKLSAGGGTEEKAAPKKKAVKKKAAKLGE